MYRITSNHMKDIGKIIVMISLTVFAGLLLVSATLHSTAWFMDTFIN